MESEQGVTGWQPCPGRIDCVVGRDLLAAGEDAGDGFAEAVGERADMLGTEASDHNGPAWVSGATSGAVTPVLCGVGSTARAMRVI